MLKGNFWYSIHCSLAELRYTKQIQGVKREPNPTASGLVRNNVVDIAVVHRKTYNQLIQPPIISIPPSTIHNIWGIFIRTTFSVSRQCSGVRTCHAGRAGGSILSFAVCRFESSCWKALRGLNKIESLHPPQRLVTIVVLSQGITKLLFLVECFGTQTGSASVGTEIHKPGKSGLYHGKFKELSAKVHSCHHHRLESVWKCIHPWPASPTFYIVCISCISHAFPWPRLLCRRHPTSRIGKLCLEAMPMPVNDVPGKPVFSVSYSFGWTTVARWFGGLQLLEITGN